MPAKHNGVFHIELPEVEKILCTGNISVAVIGLGRIGLPTAVAFAQAGLPVKGVDINPDIVKLVNEGKPQFKDEPNLEKYLYEVVRAGRMSATTEIKDAIIDADVIVVCLPTPLVKNMTTTNYSYLLTGCEEIGRCIRKNSIVIIESTVGPGVVEEEVIPIIEKRSGLKAGLDFGVASCPERANPSTILSDLQKIPRVVGGINKKSTDVAASIYQFVFKTKTVKVADCKTANTVKVVENVFRDINVAFMNEVAMLCDKLGMDVVEVIEACKTKYNFIPHWPGAGVGGPCLPVNPYQLLDSAKEANGLLKMVKTAREVNDSMPNYTVELLLGALKEIGKIIGNSVIAVLGVSYKPNVGDTQHSPIEAIVKKLDSLGAQVKIFDPMFVDSTVFSHKTERSLLDAVRGSDALIIGTAHDDFMKIDLAKIVVTMRKPVAIIDGRNIIPPSLAEELGVVYRGIGRGAK